MSSIGNEGRSFISDNSSGVALVPASVVKNKSKDCWVHEAITPERNPCQQVGELSLCCCHTPVSVSVSIQDFSVLELMSVGEAKMPATPTLRTSAVFAWSPETTNARIVAALDVRAIRSIGYRVPLFRCDNILGFCFLLDTALPRADSSCDWLIES